MATGSILIVDDIADNVTLLEMLLHGAGLTDTHAVVDPTQVIETATRIRPDLILLDLRMPVMDGFEILKRLRAADAKARDVPVLVITADDATSARSKALELGAKDFLSKPFDPTEVVLRVRNLLETRFLHQELKAQNTHLERGVEIRTKDLWQAVQGIEKSELELRRSREETIARLALAAEFKDDETRMHVDRMSRYCSLLAEKAGQDEESANLIRLASVLHDVGKIGIPDHIVIAPGKLSQEERLVMEAHTEIGFRILTGSNTPLLDLAASIALTHHERLNGSGYPRGLSGAEIPLEGRIAAIADVFDALTTDRRYRRRFDLGTAINTMLEGRGTLFDPELLRLFLGAMDEVLKIKEQNEDAA